MISRLQARLDAGQFVITTEVCPPKGSDCAEFIATSRSLAGMVDAINVTDNQGANMRIAPIAASALLLQEGIEPIHQVTCRDRNRLALQSDLLAAASLGVRNILALTGDHISFGDHPEGKPVFDLDSIQLLDTLNSLNSGRDLAGHPLNGATRFFCGAAAAPDAEPFELTLFKLEKKVASGARFFQTQAVFDIGHLQRFRESISHLPAKVIAGILLIKSAGMARYINRNIPGLTVPETVIDEMAAAADPQAKGVEIACRLAAEAAQLCDGIHIMAMGREDLVPKIIEAIRL